MDLNFSFKNLGFIKKGNILLNDLTIICGGNNSSKSYSIYIIHGIISQFREFLDFNLNENEIKKSWDKSKRISLDLKEVFNNLNLANIGNNFTEQLNDYFSTKDYFKKTIIDFKLNLNISDIINKDSVNFLNNHFNSLNDIKFRDENIYIQFEDDYSLKLVGSEDSKLSASLIFSLLNHILYLTLFRKLLPKSFIITSERTGASLFNEDLSSAKIQTVELVKKNLNKHSDSDAFVNILENLLYNKSSNYPIPIQENIDVIRKYSQIIKKDSFILKEVSKNEKYMNLLKKLELIIGGKFNLSKEKEINFIFGNQKIPLHITASATKSLFLLDLYLRHLAELNNILIIDEPELHLSIENQRKLAGLIISMVNLGIKCVINTHSEFLIREINNRIILNKDFPDNSLKESILKKFNIDSLELLDINKVSLFEVSKNGILSEVKPDIYGFNPTLFHNTINEGNDLTEEIIKLWDSDYE